MPNLRTGPQNTEPHVCTRGKRSGLGGQQPPKMGSVRGMIGRIPILDVEPVIDCGRRPVKAVTGESFEVFATVFREGHEMLGAEVVLQDPDGRAGPPIRMREARARDRPPRRRGHRDLDRVVAVLHRGVGRPVRTLVPRRRHQDPARPGRRTDARRGRAALRPRGAAGPRAGPRRTRRGRSAAA